MKKELKDKWVAALRSGEYKQISNNLQSNSGYCCLGVLCKVMGEEPIGKKPWGAFIFSDTNAEERTSCLPSGTQKKAELLKGDHDRLWKMNDGHQKTKRHNFSEIADWIEANVN